MLVLKRKVGQSVVVRRAWRYPVTAPDYVTVLVLVKGSETAVSGYRHPSGVWALFQMDDRKPDGEIEGWQEMPKREECVRVTLSVVSSSCAAQIGFEAPGDFTVAREELGEFRRVAPIELDEQRKGGD